MSLVVWSVVTFCRKVTGTRAWHPVSRDHLVSSLGSWDFGGLRSGLSQGVCSVNNFCGVWGGRMLETWWVWQMGCVLVPYVSRIRMVFGLMYWMAKIFHNGISSLPQHRDRALIYPYTGTSQQIDGTGMCGTVAPSVKSNPLWTHLGIARWQDASPKLQRLH